MPRPRYSKSNGSDRPSGWSGGSEGAEGLSEFKNMTLGDLLEGIVLQPLRERRRLPPIHCEDRDLKAVYDLDLDAKASHRLKEKHDRRRVPAGVEMCELPESASAMPRTVRAAYLYLRAEDFSGALERTRRAIRILRGTWGNRSVITRHHGRVSALIQQHLCQRGGVGMGGLRTRQSGTAAAGLAAGVLSESATRSDLARRVFVLPAAATPDAIFRSSASDQEALGRPADQPSRVEDPRLASPLPRTRASRASMQIHSSPVVETNNREVVVQEQVALEIGRR